MEGSATDGGSAIAVDWFGNAFVTGLASSLDFPLIRPFQNQMMGQSDAFMARLDKTGSKLAYSTYLGGSDLDYPVRIAINVIGTATITGFTFSNDFPLKEPVQASYGGGFSDAFVFRVSSNGALIYSTYLGGSNDDYGYAVFTDRSGDIWVGGSTASVKFPLKDAHQARYGGGPYDAFLSRINNENCHATEIEAVEATKNVADLLQRNLITAEKAHWILDDLRLSYCAR